MIVQAKQLKYKYRDMATVKKKMNKTAFLKSCCVYWKFWAYTFRQVTFIYFALFTIQIVSKQLKDNKKMQQSLFPEENSVTV